MDEVGVSLRVLVTGASGMLGGAIAKALGASNPTVEIFSIRHRSAIPSGVIQLSLSEINQYQFDVIVHAASPASPADHINATNVIDANVSLTERLLLAIKPNGVFVFISTGEVYGPKAGEDVRESSPVEPQLFGPRSFYPLAKILGETLSLSKNDVRGVVLRTFHTFGPGVRQDDGRSFADFIWGAAINGVVVLESKGSAVRSLLHVDDFAKGVLTVIDSPSAAGVFNIGSSIPLSILDLAQRICDVSGALLEFSARQDSRNSSPISVLTPNVEKLEALGWRQHLGVDDIIVDTLDWISEQKRLEL